MCTKQRGIPWGPMLKSSRNWTTRCLTFRKHGKPQNKVFHVDITSLHSDVETFKCLNVNQTMRRLSKSSNVKIKQMEEMDINLCGSAKMVSTVHISL